MGFAVNLRFKVSPHIMWGSVGSKQRSTGPREPCYPHKLEFSLR